MEKYREPSLILATTRSWASYIADEIYVTLELLTPFFHIYIYKRGVPLNIIISTAWRRWRSMALYIRVIDHGLLANWKRNQAQNKCWYKALNHSSLRNCTSSLWRQCCLEELNHLYSVQILIRTNGRHCLRYFIYLGCRTRNVLAISRW